MIPRRKRRITGYDHGIESGLDSFHLRRHLSSSSSPSFVVVFAVRGREGAQPCLAQPCPVLLRLLCSCSCPGAKLSPIRPPVPISKAERRLPDPSLPFLPSLSFPFLPSWFSWRARLRIALLLLSLFSGELRRSRIPCLPLFSFHFSSFFLLLPTLRRCCLFCAGHFNFNFSSSPLIFCSSGERRVVR